MENTLLRRTLGITSLVILFLLPGFSSIALSKQRNEPRTKAWLGVSVRDVPDEAAKANKLADAAGALVMDVIDNGPADSAGIREKDIIVGFGEKQIDNADDLVRAVSKATVGDKVTVQLVRKGEKQTLQVVLGKSHHRTPSAMNDFFRRMPIAGHGSDQGMQLMELNDQLAEYFGAPDQSGILVVKVKKGSAAEKAGIKAGDVLLKMGKRTIDDMEDVSKALAKYDDGDMVEVEVLRKGANKTLSLEVVRDSNDYSFDFLENGWGNENMLRMPPFQEFHYVLPHWNDKDLQLDIPHNMPDMDILERKLQNLQQSLKEEQRTTLIRIVGNTTLQNV